MVSIETYWNQTVVFDPYPPNIGYDDPELSADLVLITHEHPDHNHPEAVQGEPTVVHGLDDRGQVKAITGVLDRLPNEAESTWTTGVGNGEHSGNAIAVSTVPAWHDNEQGGERGATTIFVVDVDGVRIAHCGDLGQEKLTEEQVTALGEVDVLLLPVGGIYTLDGAQAAEIVRQVKPRIAVPIHYKTPALTFGLQNVDAFVTAIESDSEVVRPKGNTLAVSATNDDASKTTAVVLGYEPWQPTGELADMFTAMETACSDSQQVFAPLSAEQMNFRPSDGTHTPRWNVEHMAGVQLRFFSQVYAALDPAISAIDLNPAQMPDDYEAAHPDWTGAEEARQIERVSDFVRRFSYLLDGVDLDEPAPGSRLSLRRLLGIMQGHYGQHTANVEKKFELADWPSE
jgi:L-ascorbate metabolism protein UlaG (beta-lactamase superfamily)